MEQIGPYQVIGEIGRGGMGVVLHGLDPAIGRPVAIKVILLREFSDPKDREMLRARLFREARAAGILSHPGIVTVYYVGEEGENAFIAMEYVNGPTLEKVLSAPQPPGKELLRRVLWQTAAALDYAHSKGIVHRDIKPANIMLDESGAVKICDFGIAKGLAGQTALTQTGTSLGSPFYMSPEQIQGGSLDHRTDQYSLGVVAYQALTGKRPFQSVHQIQSLFFHIMNEPPAPAYQVNPALSPGVSEVLQKALAKDPAARYPSCTSFVRALLEEWDAEPAPAPIREAEPEITRQTVPAPSRPRRSLWIAGLAAAAVVAALGGAAWYWAKVSMHERAVPKQEIIPPAKSETSVSPSPPPPATLAPVIQSFTVEPRAVAPGMPATLKWSVMHAAEVRISPGIGVVDAEGTRSVVLQSPTIYKLTAKAAAGPFAHRAATASVTLQVIPPPSIEDFSASRASVPSGQAAVLRWNVTGADRVSIDRGIGEVPPRGTQGVFPTASGNYVLQAAGPGGSVNRSIAVSVTYEGKLKIVKFLADPATIDAGETAVLRWEVVNAAEVRIEPGVGRVDAQGRFKVSPDATTSYRIFATLKGTFHLDATVTVRK